jgi:hypothetical protein
MNDKITTLFWDYVFEEDDDKAEKIKDKLMTMLLSARKVRADVIK